MTLPPQGPLSIYFDRRSAETWTVSPWLEAVRALDKEVSENLEWPARQGIYIKEGSALSDDIVETPSLHQFSHL